MAQEPNTYSKEPNVGTNIINRMIGIPNHQPKSRSKKGNVDYRDRWPTVSTLVSDQSQSRVFHDDDDDYQRTPLRVKALEAVATPLDWLADKLGSISEHLDQRIELAEVKAENRASIASNRRATAKPGQSTHPYDTGVESAQGRREASRYLSAHSAQEQPRASLDFQRHESTDASQESIIKRPAKVRFRHRSNVTPESRHSRPTRSPDSSSAPPHSPAHCLGCKDDPDPSSRVDNNLEAVEKPHKRWWRRPFGSANGTGEWPPESKPSVAQETESTGRRTSPGLAPDELDVAAIPKPRRAWKSVRNRRASVYPGKERKHAGIARGGRSRHGALAASQSTHRPKSQFGVPSSSTHPPSTGEVSMPVAQNVHGLLRARGRSKPGVPRNPLPCPASEQTAALSTVPSRTSRTRSRVSSANRSHEPAADSVHSGQPGTSATRDFALLDDAPRSGVLRQWLNLLGGKPGSRPLEFSEGEDPEELPPHSTMTSCRTGRKSTDTGTSRGTNRGTRTIGNPPTCEPMIMPDGQSTCNSRRQRSSLDAGSSRASHEQKREGWLAQALKLRNLAKDTGRSSLTGNTTPESARSQQQNGKTSPRTQVVGVGQDEWQRADIAQEGSELLGRHRRGSRWKTRWEKGRE